MEVLGTILLICMITLFGIGALANAWESSKRNKYFDDKDEL